MSEPYLGEIRMVAFDALPRGWLPCEGQLLSITANQALFSLLNNRFGGDGRVNFQLPDLRGRTPLHVSAVKAIGTAGGVETVTLATDHVPAHTHRFQVSTTTGTVAGVAGAWYAAPEPVSATSGPTLLYGEPKVSNDVVQLYPGSLLETGGGQAHSNMQPYLAMKYIIATQGIYPPRP
ncbi:phage tail protein [Azorhizobium doebereinerae]|uniref:phage tail protein n=1 Tax=Azorhizobium doebereinerae TaxID=281091 RepID=UPI00048E120C|nr:tail fiber protein [Azorhizobium doebereinerae]